MQQLILIYGALNQKFSSSSSWHFTCVHLWLFTNIVEGKEGQSGSCEHALLHSYHLPYCGFHIRTDMQSVSARKNLHNPNCLENILNLMQLIPEDNNSLFKHLMGACDKLLNLGWGLTISVLPKQQYFTAYIFSWKKIPFEKGPYFSGKTPTFAFGKEAEY